MISSLAPLSDRYHSMVPIGRKLLSKTGGSKRCESNTSEMTAVPANLSGSKMVCMWGPSHLNRFFGMLILIGMVPVEQS
jgi:hypothetical protein